MSHKCFILDNGLRIQMTGKEPPSPELQCLLSQIFEAAYARLRDQQLGAKEETDSSTRL